MFSQTTLLGRLGADPQPRVSKLSGKQYLDLSVATESWNGRDQCKETDWHRVRVIFPKQVDYIIDRAKKGDVIHVVGQYKSYQFTPKESTERVTVYFVLAQEVHVITPRRPVEPEQQQTERDDIPF